MLSFYDIQLLISFLLEQVIQFHFWKASEFAYTRREVVNHQNSSKLCLLEANSDGLFILPCNNHFGNTIFGRSTPTIPESSFNWDELKLTVKRWEEYTGMLRKSLYALMPYWISQQTISFIEPSMLQKNMNQVWR